MADVALSSEHPRRTIAAVRMIIAMMDANQRAERNPWCPRPSACDAKVPDRPEG
jgi:hypothetical protein